MADERERHDEAGSSGSTESPIPEAEAEADRAPGDSGRLRYRPTLADHVRVNGALARRSGAALGSAAFILTEGVVIMSTTQPLGIALLLLGLAMGSGLLVAPFLWLAARRRPDLLLAEIEIAWDQAGLTMATGSATTRMSWSVYRGFRETGDAILLDPGVGRQTFVLKRGVDSAQLDHFRATLVAAGVRARRTKFLRPLLAVAIGVILAGAAPGYAFLQRANTNAAMSLSAEVAARLVTIQGTTNVPDGSAVLVELLQEDEYDKAAAAGAPIDVGSSRWAQIATVTVLSGAFSTSFEVPDWPPGRVGGYAYFWIYPGQPPEVITRYGDDGRLMNGPDVVQTDDRGRMLRAQTNFELP